MRDAPALPRPRAARDAGEAPAQAKGESMTRRVLTVEQLDELEALRGKAVDECLRNGNKKPPFKMPPGWHAVAAYVKALQLAGGPLIRMARLTAVACQVEAQSDPESSSERTSPSEQATREA